VRILLCYFSGTGNTWWLCNRFKEMAEERGAEVTLRAMDEFLPKGMGAIVSEWCDSDVIGLAYPVHSSDAPPLVYRFLQDVAEGMEDGRRGPEHAFVLTTMQSFSGDGALMLEDGLAKMGVRIRVSRDFRMSPNTGVPFLTFNPLTDEKLERQMARTLAELEGTVDLVVQGKEMRKVQYGSFGRFNGWLQRVGPKWKNRTWRYFGAHPDRCTLCMLCVEQCPTGAIELEGEELRWTPECTDCFRCYNFCPERAVTVKGFAMREGRHRQHIYFRDRGFPPG